MKYKDLFTSKLLMLSIGVFANGHLHSSQTEESAVNSSQICAATRAASSSNIQTANRKKNINAIDEYIQQFNTKSYPGFYFTGDFTYWIAKQDGLAYALTGLLQDATSTVSLQNQGKVYLPNSQWDPGFKVGIGYVLEENVWDLFLNWTWYNSNTHGHASGPNAFDDNTLFAEDLYSRFLFSVLQSSKVRWALSYNTLDFALGRLFAIGDSFSVKPFSGLRSAWIHQKFNIHGTGIDVNNPQFPPTNYMTNRFNFGSVGLRNGLSTVWYFNKYFSFFGDGSFSLLYGLTRNYVKLITASSAGQEDNINTRNFVHSLKTEFEFALGFRYELAYNKDRYHFSFDVAWEYLNWINMNRFYVPVSGTDPEPALAPPYQASGQFLRVNGDLGLMGFTTGFKFSF